MKQIVLTIPDNEYSFFMSLLKKLSFASVKIERSAKKKEILNGLKEGYNEMLLIEKGQLKAPSLKELFD